MFLTWIFRCTPLSNLASGFYLGSVSWMMRVGSSNLLGLGFTSLAILHEKRRKEGD